jgi:membrane fusion protein (multidrug efflux system)
MSPRSTTKLFFPRSGAVLLSATWAIVLCGCNDHTTAPAEPVTTAATLPTAPQKPAPQIVESPETRPFSTTGPLVAEQQADISAERDGHVTHVAVQIGDRVRRGQVLAVLDDRSLRAACDSQKAKLASLDAQIAEWQAEQKSEEADLRRADLMRKEKIRSEEDWEHVKYKLDETIAEVARYRADRAAAQADLVSANLALEESRITAPFDGVVGRSSLRAAQEVKKGDVLLWITATGPLRILFTVPESAMAAFPTGAELDLTTPNYPQLHQPARILRVSPVVDPASASLQVIGLLVHTSPLLKPGMTMQVSPTAQRDPRTAR